MRAKKLLIGGIVAILAIAGIVGYLIVSTNISPAGEDDYSFEEIDEILGDLEGLGDIETELQLEDWDLDIYFD